METATGEPLPAEAGEPTKDELSKTPDCLC